ERLPCSNRRLSATLTTPQHIACWLSHYWSHVRSDGSQWSQKSTNQQPERLTRGNWTTETHGRTSRLATWRSRGGEPVRRSTNSSAHSISIRTLPPHTDISPLRSRLTVNQIRRSSTASRPFA